jgi:hypothetical protein
MIEISNFGGNLADMVIFCRGSSKCLPLSPCLPGNRIPTLNAIRDGHRKTWQIVMVLQVLAGMTLT